MKDLNLKKDERVDIGQNLIKLTRDFILLYTLSLFERTCGKDRFQSICGSQFPSSSRMASGRVGVIDRQVGR